MITISITVSEDSERIDLGRRLENEATEVVFDTSYLTETYGEGTAYLFAKRSEDDASYPVDIEQDSDADTVTWTVSNADTQYAGQGKAELFWYVDDLLAKSVVYTTWTSPDIGDSTEAPEAQEAWTEALIEEITALKEAAEAAQEATEELLSQTIYIGSDGNFYLND